MKKYNIMSLVAVILGSYYATPVFASELVIEKTSRPAYYIPVILQESITDLDFSQDKNNSSWLQELLDPQKESVSFPAFLSTKSLKLLAISYKDKSDQYLQIQDREKGYFFLLCYAKTLAGVLTRSINQQENICPEECMVLGDAFNTLGLHVFKAHKKSKAMAFYEKAIFWVEKSKDVSRAEIWEYGDFIEKIHINMAVNYSQDKEYKKAIHYYCKCILSREKRKKELKKDGYDSLLSRCYYELAICYNLIKNHKLSADYSQKSVKVDDPKLLENQEVLINKYFLWAESCLFAKHAKQSISMGAAMLKLMKGNKGDYHPYVIETYQLLAGIECNNKKFSKAIEYLSEALHILLVNRCLVLRTLLKNDSKLATDYNKAECIEDMHFILGQHIKQFLNSAVGEQEQELWANYKSIEELAQGISKTYAGLGYCYEKQGNPLVAIEKYHNFLQFSWQCLDGNPQLNYGIQKIADLHAQAGNLNEARKFCEQSLITRKGLAKKSYQMQSSPQELNIGRSNKESSLILPFAVEGCPLPSIVEIIQKLEKIYIGLHIPLNNDFLKSTYFELGTLFYKQKNHSQVIKFYEKYLVLESRSEHRELWLSNIYDRLAHAYHCINTDKNRKEFDQKAIDYATKSLCIKRNKLGNDHYEVGLTCKNLGFFYKRQEKHTKAITFLKEADNLLSSMHEEKSIMMRIEVCNELSICYTNVGNDYYENKQKEKAIRSLLSSLNYATKALTMKKKIYSPNNIHIVMSLSNIASIYCCLGDITVEEQKFENDIYYLDWQRYYLQAKNYSTEASRIAAKQIDKEVRITQLVYKNEKEVNSRYASTLTAF